MEKIIENMVISFLSKHKKLIKRIMKPYGENSLFYVIVMKNDTTRNRAELLSFLDEFELTPYANYFNVTFYFIPEQFEKSIISKLDVAI